MLLGASVDAVQHETGLRRTKASGGNGYYAFVNLPVGHYTITVAHEGFQTEVLPDISVQAERTVTVNATLAVGAVSTSVTVNAVPLMNALTSA